MAKFHEDIKNTIIKAENLKKHFLKRIEENPQLAKHTRQLLGCLDSVCTKAKSIQANRGKIATSPDELIGQVEQILQESKKLKKQAPQTLFRLRLVEIGLPLVLSIVSILLTLRYPLTEERCYEIKESLKKRQKTREQ